MSEAKKDKVLMYKGKPLVRQDNVIYYGFPTDKAILYMNILGTERHKEGNLCRPVSIWLVLIWCREVQSHQPRQ